MVQDQSGNGRIPLTSVNKQVPICMLLVQGDSVTSRQIENEPGFEYWCSLRFTLIWLTGLAQVNWLKNRTYDFSKYLHMLYANTLNLNKPYLQDFQVQMRMVSLHSALNELNKNKIPLLPQGPGCTNSLKIDND